MLSNINEAIKAILIDVLHLPENAKLDQSTPLLGSIAELDSMAVVAILTTIEEDFGIEIYDDEINADVFATLGSLSSYVKSKQ